MITLSIADLYIDVDNRYPYIEEFAKDYMANGEAAFCVRATDEDIENERALSEYDFDIGYIESIAIFRKIAERIPEYSGFVFHGAIIADGGRAYAVTARSGVGKTTHLRLWLEAFGKEVHILNGDKPIIRLIDGVPYACATPWRGKEGYGVNEMLPLSGIAFLERSESCFMEKTEPKDALLSFLTQIYIPNSPHMARQALLLADNVIKKVPLFRLGANMTGEAAECARRAFRGEE